MISPAPIETIVFHTSLVTIGAFRCSPDDPRFEDSGPIRQHCFVFPRSAVTIEHEHERVFVANPNVVTLYNRGERYLRGRVSREGDRCDWFGLDEGLAREVLERRGADSFRTHRLASAPALYLAQRRLFECVARGESGDPLAVEERVLLLLEQLLDGAPPRVVPASRSTRRCEAVAAAEEILSRRWNEELQLADLARETGLSAFHLCRAFRSGTGRTLHQYRHQLRLRHGLELVGRPGLALVDIALELGFSSHSHFTSAFRREFGCVPSAERPRAH